MCIDASWIRRIPRPLQGASLLLLALNLSAVAGCSDGSPGDVTSDGSGGTGAASGTGGVGGVGGTSGAGGTNTGGSGAAGGVAGAGGSGAGGVGGAGGTGGASGEAGSAGAGGVAGSAGASGAAGSAGSGGAVWPAACSKCHGEPDNPAPPRDLDGNVDPIHPGVGAHRAHLGASSWRHEIQCAECHTVPTNPGWDPDMPTHLNGYDDLVWGPIAKQGAYHTGTGTCSSSYCHGGTFGPDAPGQSSNRTPVWTTVDGSQASCGTSCHTLPPGGGHPPSVACEACHSNVIASFTPGSPPSVTWTDASRHIDGVLEVAGLTCTGCHGDPITNNPAPPRGTKGETDTNEPAVGAHAQHLASSGWHRKGQCTDCHAYPGTINHSNGMVDFTWGGPSNTGNPGPAYAKTSATCTNTYCHGSTLDGPKPGGSVRRTPVWNQVDGTFDGCGTTCHTNPPGGSHPASTACATCHDAVIAAYVPTSPPQVTWKDAELHVDGMVQVGNLSCTSCHGDSVAGTPAPPMGTNGETATTEAAVGAHAQHLATSTWHRQGQCTDCHAYPSSIQHADGAVDFSWGGPSNAGNPGPSYVASTTTCANTYCHGNTLEGPKPGGAIQRTPDWTVVNGTQDACGTTCHTNPPGGAHVAISDCKLCHGQVIGPFDPSTSTATWVSAANHVNGIVEASAYHDLPQWTTPKKQSQHHGTAYFISNRQRDEHGTGCTVCHGAALDGGKVGVSCNNTACHGGQDWKSCTFCHGTPPAQTNPPRGVLGETTTDTLGVGRHATHLTGGASHVAFACNTCHVVPASGDVSHAIDYVPSTSLNVPGHHGDVEFSGVASGMVFDVTATQGSPVTARGTCLLACHSDGRGNPPNVTPYWAGGTWKKGDCGSCHDATPTTGDHGVHHAQGGCAVCHPTVPGAPHVNGIRDVKTSMLGPNGGGIVAIPPGGGGPGAPCGNRWMCNGMCHGNNGSAFHSQYCW